MKYVSAITPELTEQFRAAFEADKTLNALKLMMNRSELADAAFDRENAAKVNFTFNVEIPTTGITNQKRSGRCWLFASMNLMRELVIKKCNLAEFELSGNWLAFWDKFEKINYYLECSMDSAALPLDDRTVSWLNGGIGDGGQWDMMVSLIKKYGIVPMSAMPETAQSCSTAGLMRQINSKLREDGLELRALLAEGKDPAPRKQEMLQEMFNALVICLGMPPKTFDFEYMDKDKAYHVDRGLTPHSFMEKYVGIDLGEYVSIINAPTADKPFHRTYTVKYIGNVVEDGILYLNLPMDEMKALAVAQMQAGEPVWFGSDCGKSGDRSTGIWDVDSFDYSTVLGGMQFGLTKQQRLDSGDSAMNHAMLLCGVNLDENGKPNRWKIENSWGAEAGNKGYYVCSDRWFDQFTYQVIINKKFLSADQLAMLEQAPVVLNPWDPMGTLA